MKNTLAFIIPALLIISLAACTAQPVEPVEDFEVVDAAALPSKADLRDYDGKNYVTSVKSQRFGDCWTFSLAGSAEIAYLFANDMGVPAGEVNDKVDFSEKYIAWYLFHGITADDVITGKVRASQIGEGFDPSQAEDVHENAAYNIGGRFVHCSDLFGSGFGPVDESVSVNGEYPYSYDPTQTEYEWWLPLTAEYRNAPSAAVLRESLSLPCPAGSDANGDYEFSEEGLLAMKSEIYKGHGVSAAFCSSLGSFNGENMAVYYDGDANPDHAITIVGYDDNFPKEKFTRKSRSGDPIEGSTPPDNGAFICKNSWGIIDSEEDGYFYISYYDHSLSTPLSYEFDSNSAVKYNDPNYDQYDLMMTQWYCSADHDSETKTANVFDAEADEDLYQIVYITGRPMTEVTYEIYKNVADDDPTSGTLLEKGAYRHTYAGYHRIGLKNEYPLKKGEKYSVVLTMKRVVDGTDDMVYTESFPYSMGFYKGMTVKGVINKGESWFYSDGKWSDMSDIRDSLIDTAYRHCIEEFDPDDLKDIEADSKETFTIDNYPIKAILHPSTDN